MNTWSSVSIVQVAHVYLLHCVGIYPLKNITAVIPQAWEHSPAGSQTCLATRPIVAITEMPQVRSTHITCPAYCSSQTPRHSAPLPHVHVAVTTWMQWPFLLCDLLGILSPSFSSSQLCLKPRAKLSIISAKYLLCWISWDLQHPNCLKERRCIYDGKNTVFQPQ